MLAFAAAPLRAQSHKKPQKKPPEVPFSTAAARHDPMDTVGVVNGTVIHYGDFMSIMAGYLKLFVARSKNDIVSDSLYSLIVDSSWDRAVYDIIIENAIAKRHLSMTDEMVKDSLVEHPPEYLRRQFSDSVNTFHPEYMRAAMNDPRNDSTVHLIIEGERERMETERLEESIAPSAFGPERDRSFLDWLHHEEHSARIEDRRIRYGFY